MAYRMQVAAKELVDSRRRATRRAELYGLKGRSRGRSARSACWRGRLVERGVRFVQAYINDEWDAHGSIKDNHDARCAETDVPIAGLLTRPEAAGLLDTTLVVWGGEFGGCRSRRRAQGRDHNPHGFLMWMAGGGVKGGVSYGETDEIGYKAAVDPVSVHDVTRRSCTCWGWTTSG
jgi:uncharacterized protein (DUF1501 family)